MAPSSAPYRHEGQAWRAGHARVAGVDEAGRGPLAGPGVAAAVVVTPEHRIRRCASVAAASIVAKVTRDRIMVELDKQFPEYGFARHKGYGTPDHLAALDRHGPCAVHRRTFAGVWRQGELFVLEEED